MKTIQHPETERLYWKQLKFSIEKFRLEANQSTSVFKAIYEFLSLPLTVSRKIRNNFCSQTINLQNRIRVQKEKFKLHLYNVENSQSWRK